MSGTSSSGGASGNSIGDFFVNLFFKVDDKSQKEAEGLIDGLRHKLHEIAKDAWAFNEVRESVHALLEPLRELYETVAQVAEKGDSLNNLAVVLGTTTQQLEQMQFVGHLADVEMGTMNFSLSMLSRQMGEMASGGGKEVAAAFTKLGVSAKDTQGHMRNVGDLMPELIEKFGGVKDANERMNIAQDIFGRGARQLMPLLTKQSEELAAMNKQFRELGGAYSPELIENSAKFSDNVKLANFALGNMKRDLATGIIPELNNFFNIWIGFVKQSWPDISHTLTSLGAAIGDAFMKTAGTAFDSFLKYIREVAANKEVLDGLAATVKIVAVAFAIWLAIMAPGLVLVGALALAIEDLMGAVEGKDSVVGRMALSFKEWTDEMRQTYSWMEKIISAMNWLTTDHIGNAMGWNKDLPGGRDKGMFEEDGLVGSFADQQRRIEQQKFLGSFPEPSKTNNQRITAQQMWNSHPDMAVDDLKAMIGGMVGEPEFMMTRPDDRVGARMREGASKTTNNRVQQHFHFKGGNDREMLNAVRDMAKQGINEVLGQTMDDLGIEGE